MQWDLSIWKTRGLLKYHLISTWEMKSLSGFVGGIPSLEAMFGRIISRLTPCCHILHRTRWQKSGPMNSLIADPVGHGVILLLTLIL